MTTPTVARHPYIPYDFTEYDRFVTERMLAEPSAE